jgi:hypothetical protein
MEYTYDIQELVRPIRISLIKVAASDVATWRMSPLFAPEGRLAAVVRNRQLRV